MRPKLKLMYIHILFSVWEYGFKSIEEGIFHHTTFFFLFKAGVNMNLSGILGSLKRD